MGYVLKKIVAMEKKMTGFRLDERLKDRLGAYCDNHGFKQERALEALVYSLIVKETPTAEDVFRLIQEMAEWEITPQPESPVALPSGVVPSPDIVNSVTRSLGAVKPEKQSRPQRRRRKGA